NIEHRLHHIQGKKKDYDAFFEACVDDVPVAPVINLYQSLLEAQWEVRIWSGRSNQVFDQTQTWIHRHVGNANGLSRMRSAGDYRPDDALKEGWLWELSYRDRYRLQFIVDDRKRVVDMWRRNGVICLHCAEGNF
ncbi:MAG TPA: hypothetical protein VIG24_16285, partial [Acidimicrobiia bacterium]